jgi:hypothetical protein
VNPFHFFGMQGSIRRPSVSGRTPRTYRVIAKWVHVAEPESQGIREAPCLGLCFECVDWHST